LQEHVKHTKARKSNQSKGRYGKVMKSTPKPATATNSQQQHAKASKCDQKHAKASKRQKQAKASESLCESK